MKRENQKKLVNVIHNLSVISIILYMIAILVYSTYLNTYTDLDYLQLKREMMRFSSILFFPLLISAAAYYLTKR